MGRHVHVRAHVAGACEEYEADAGEFVEPMSTFDTGLVQCAPALFVAGSALISVEYHDEHGES